MKLAMVPSPSEDRVRLLCMLEVESVLLNIPQQEKVLPQIWLIYPPAGVKHILTLTKILEWLKQSPTAYMTPDHVGVLFQVAFEKGSVLHLWMDPVGKTLVEMSGCRKIELIASGEQDFDPEDSQPFVEAVDRSSGIVELYVAKGTQENYEPVWKTTLLSIEKNMPELHAVM